MCSPVTLLLLLTLTGARGGGQLFNNRLQNLHDFYRRPSIEFKNFQQNNFRRQSTVASVLCQSYFSAVDDTPTSNDTDCPVPSVKSEDCKYEVRFRTLDGRCNNLEKPTSGMAGQPFRQLGEPVEPSASLPSPTDIAKIFLAPPSESSLNSHPPPPFQTELSQWFLTWAHIVQIDLVNLAQIHATSGSCLDCCSLSVADPACDLSLSDTAPHGHDCLPYTRILPGLQTGCPDDQARSGKNLETSFLDASFLYGTNEADLGRLREYAGGRMKVLEKYGTGSILPPLQANIQGGCRSALTPCFDSGSQGINLQPQTVVLGGLFLSEHNRLARELQALNPAWTDEQIFQSARDVVIAELQHISTNEFLPKLIGHTKVVRSGIATVASQHSHDYDAKKEAAILDVYAAAVGPFYMTMFSPGFVTSQRKLFVTAETFYDPSSLLKAGIVDDLIQALLLNSPYKVGRLDPVTNQQFLKVGHKSHNLLALLVQINRDLGVPKYFEIREYCGLSDINQFEDLEMYMSEQRINQLRQLYNDVRDIDTIIGGLAELPLAGALFGPTFACIAETQWAALKKADRHWYDSYLEPTAFTKEQLVEIQHVTLASLICQNSQVSHVQPEAFLPSDALLNCPVDCDGSTIKKLDIKKWTDVEPVYSAPFTKETIEALVRSAVAQVETNAHQDVDRLLKKPDGLADVNRNPGVFRHGKIQRIPKHARALFKASAALQETTLLVIKKIQEQGHGNEVDFQELLPQIDLAGTVVEIPEDECLVKQIPCDHTSLYRTATGWCNNLNFPQYGMSFRPFRRIAKPTYHDGISMPRSLSVSGKHLPGARRVSSTTTNTHSHKQSRYSHVLMLWGQFLDHDLGLAPLAESANGEALDCSDCDSHDTVSRDCLPIPIPPNDPNFKTTTDEGKPRCLSFVRSAVGQNKVGHREQINILTSFIDASNVYGSDDCDLARKRSFEDGRLRSQFLNRTFEELLPPDPGNHDCLNREPDKCFEAGDIRVNEHLGLACMHTVFMRLHNKMVHTLSVLNPSWDDETLYQEARKINGAINQHITYNEFLPRFLGRKIMEKFDLSPQKLGYYEGYNHSCDAGLSNEFSTIGFRIGHTLIDGTMQIVSPQFKEEITKPLVKLFFNPVDAHKNFWIAKVLMGFIRQPCQSFDNSVDENVRNKLFEEPDRNNSGMDLIALNVQRAREHGLPSYTQLRELFGLSVPRSFDDLSPDIMPLERVQALKMVYEHVEDIDGFIGIIQELPMFGALVGPTAAHILAEQFSRLRRCDRFWYENGGHSGALTAGQLREIRKVTLAKIMCNTMQSMFVVQQEVFDQPDDFLNKPMRCEDLPDMDLSVWKETGFCYVFGRRIPLGHSERISACVSCTCTKDGRLCKSIRVHHCEEFIRDHGGKAFVKSDKACRAQCEPYLI